MNKVNQVCFHAMKKIMAFVNNYSTPAEWIEYVSDGDRHLEDHYLRKWSSLYNKSPKSAVVDFWHMLDSEHEELFLDYVLNKWEA